MALLHRTTLRPAASSTTSTSSSLEPPSSPTRFPPPLAPPSGGTSNEQFHYCLTPVINLHGRPLALPPLPRAHPPSLPPATLSRFSPLFHLFSPEDSTLARTTPHPVSCFLRLSFSALRFIAFIHPPRLLCIFFLVSCVPSIALTPEEEKEKMKNARSAYSALFT